MDLWIRMLVCCPSCFLLIIILIVVMGCSCLLEESNERLFRIIILFATPLPDNALQFLIPVHELLHSPLQLPMILPNLLTTKLFALFILKKKTSCPVKVDIFSSDTGKWVRRRVMLSTELPHAAADADEYGCIRRSIYLDGMIYKLSFVVNYLIRFDLNAPSDVAIELPHKNAADRHGFIGMSRGSLYYSYHDESGLMISIWLLEDRCKRDPFWKLTHRISVDSLTSKYPDVRNSGFHFHTYAIHPASDIIFLGNPTMVISYDLKSNKSEEVFTLSSGLKISSGQHFVHLYSPCYAVLSNFDNNCG
ncbi:hypothetical protein POPTR_013G109701v4 [Populus trichocarpa]|uniref:Uncharacterized protein n=1 Tax=Populus trichocarpa TaxID=3694 RepID=B9MWF2_POPTR|nr:hypothetical protein POPTR_013G109701v4 [Populus trichocarpa]